jgi:hypothetical protein
MWASQCHGILLLYDVSSKDSFTHMKQLFEGLPLCHDQSVSNLGYSQRCYPWLRPELPHIPVVLVGCNSDPPTRVRVSGEDVSEFVQQHPEVIVAGTAIPSTREGVDATVQILIERVHELLKKDGILRDEEKQAEQAAESAPKKVSKSLVEIKSRIFKAVTGFFRRSS